MIQWYFDLDGVVFDFDSALIKMVNETLGKNYGKEVLKPYSYELGMGLTKDMVNHYLKQMTAENRWETLATYDTIHFLYMIECAEHFRQEYDLGLSFITSRSHETLPQTLRCFQNLLVPMGFRRKYPLLYSDKATGVYKWSVIKALEMGEGGVYVDDSPTYIQEVREHCPNTVCIWSNMGGLYDRPVDIQCHYEVNSWPELIDLLVDKTDEDEWYPRSAEELIMNSRTPGIQMEIR